MTVAGEKPEKATFNVGDISQSRPGLNGTGVWQGDTQLPSVARSNMPRPYVGGIRPSAAETSTSTSISSVRTGNRSGVRTGNSMAAGTGEYNMASENLFESAPITLIDTIQSVMTTIAYTTIWSARW